MRYPKTRIPDPKTRTEGWQLPENPNPRKFGFFIHPIWNPVLNVKMAGNYSNLWLNRPCLIRFSFPALPDCLPRAFWVIYSHFCIKEHGAKWKISSLWSFRAQDGPDWTKIDRMVTLFLRRAASRRAALSLSLCRRWSAPKKSVEKLNKNENFSRPAAQGG